MMNPPIDSKKHVKTTTKLEIATQHAPTETDELVQQGFTNDEIISLLWLRQWYQQGGSDRIEIVRRLEFIKLLVIHGKIEA